MSEKQISEATASRSPGEGSGDWDETVAFVQALPETPEPRTREDILLAAAALIEERGLNNGDFVDAAGRVCLAGAVAIASGSDPDTLLPERYQLYARGQAVGIAQCLLGADFGTIWEYNDHTLYRGKRPRGRWWGRRLSREAWAAGFLREIAAGAPFPVPVTEAKP